jgi:hypothetical protein
MSEQPYKTTNQTRLLVNTLNHPQQTAAAAAAAAAAAVPYSQRADSTKPAAASQKYIQAYIYNIRKYFILKRYVFKTFTDF